MTDQAMIDLVTRYFMAIDAHDPDAMAETLSEDCVLSIETHGITLDGRTAIRSLFATRWESAQQAKAMHHDFTHSPSLSTGRIASQFTVTYSGPDAGPPKSNANVFTINDGLFTKISVYMAGENTIKT